MAKLKPMGTLPRKIRVGKKMYTIDIVETMLHFGDMSRIHYEESNIKIGKKSNVTGKKFNKADLNNSFWHELVHAILHDMGQHTLNRDEDFVTEFADRLHTAIDSARFK